MDEDTSQIWIDLESGTWGDSKSIRFLDLTREEIASLDDMGDSSRIEFAIKKLLKK